MTFRFIDFINEDCSEYIGFLKNNRRRTYIKCNIESGLCFTTTPLEKGEILEMSLNGFTYSGLFEYNDPARIFYEPKLPFKRKCIKYCDIVFGNHCGICDNLISHLIKFRNDINRVTWYLTTKVQNPKLSYPKIKQLERDTIRKQSKDNLED